MNGVRDFGAPPRIVHVPLSMSLVSGTYREAKINVMMDPKVIPVAPELLLADSQKSIHKKHTWVLPAQQVEEKVVVI